VHKFLSFFLTGIFYLTFLFFFVLFHAIQWLSYNFIGIKAQKKTIDLLNFFLVASYQILFIKISFKFLGKIPKNKIKIFVSNHQSFFEIPPLIWFLRKFEPRFISKKELGKGIPSVSYYLRKGGSVLIDRKKSNKALDEIKEFCDRVKKNNWSIVIFPEGTRSKNGVPRKFQKKGLELLLKEIPEALIVPITINNSFKINHWNGFPIPLCIKLSFKVHHVIPNNIKDVSSTISLIESKIKEHIL